MSKLDFPSTIELYGELFDLQKLAPGELCRVLESLAQHAGQALEKPLSVIRTRIFDKQGRLLEPELFEKWLGAVSLGLPTAADVFASIFDSPCFAQLDEPTRISFVNHIINFGHTAKPETAGKLLLTMLKTEKSKVVQGRLVRAFAQLRLRDEKAAIFAKENVTKPELTQSTLYFTEAHPHRKALPLLTEAPANDEIATQ